MIIRIKCSAALAWHRGAGPHYLASFPICTADFLMLRGRLFRSYAAWVYYSWSNDVTIWPSRADVMLTISSFRRLDCWWNLNSLRKISWPHFLITMNVLSRAVALFKMPGVSPAIVVVLSFISASILAAKEATAFHWLSLYFMKICLLLSLQYSNAIINQREPTFLLRTFRFYMNAPLQLAHFQIIITSFVVDRRSAGGKCHHFVVDASKCANYCASKQSMPNH